MTSTSFARTVRGSTGPGVALAHGAGGSVEAHYGPILDGLAAHRTVVGVDYPGSGATPRLETPLTLDQLADEVVGAAVDEGLERFAVVGFSVGGPVAVRAATRHPDRVAALVLTATYSHLDNYMRLAGDISAGIMASGDLLLLAKLLTWVSLSPRTLASLPDDALEAAAAATAEALSPGAPEQFDLFGRINTRAELAGVTAPTLVIASTEDRVVPLYLQQDLAARIPGARLTEVSSGHMLPIEQPEEWQKLITSFLDEIGA
ncbi:MULTISPECIES: alpha/beta fold hydrolase [unclassified Pseudofrankia]|uniref:alpha/beta fold hydrolase n=1 Tax=unclassified Pseudofrankia TaxID=2994372 RepID=UPI0008D9C464|nr:MULTISPECIES: alpha/beta hydrolase [unclassified Pseudofrankia]MDT3446756.1 alpha/beta hydrolase [Pseudofrankia sp. BMG5.37]OHV59934.1 alpha/beta hydrolase [Pseudofrankia sp. BMG5.36]